MNAKKYSSFIATALIAFVALFGVYPPSTYAAGPAVSGKYYGAPWCGNCVVAKGTQSFQNAVAKGFIKDINVDTLPQALKPGSIPRLELFDAAGNPVGDAIVGYDGAQGAMGKAFQGLAEQVPKQEDQIICIPPRPGQDEQNGPITDDPSKTPGNPTRDTEPPIIESEENFQLRKLGSATTAEEVKRATSQPVESGTVKMAATPDAKQSKEFTDSLGGNPSAQGTYTINGVKVQAGKKYKVGEPDPETGITFDKDCKPTQGPIADPGKTNPGGANPGFGDLGNGGGGGGGFGGGGGGNGGGGFGGGGGGFGGLGGGGGGLAALLPLLMQGLLGGGQQGGQQNGQNQYGAGYGNQQQNCVAQSIAPVCGMDGKTYNNQCYLNQLGVILRNTGVCVQPSTSPTPTPTPNINNIITLTHLAQSGIPASLLDNVRNLVSSVLSGILSGANISETVVR